MISITHDKFLIADPV